ncbi:uncharacterized protein ALTATR162_LOCUS3311 [Alternaria atra]|uniref:2EXR domain-containing protein n=1 Tax=Alternaria atra TaxID=119953 RepID=A0A8J2HYA2_9PLEO|nr:uncharacterized protein ALTATR162_LOCUS3311 [Alternaria atra]CAG5153742.1 unnamed protein product [Alternaria atra]
MMAMLTVKESPEDAVMTTDSAAQSFNITCSGAMNIDRDNGSEGSGLDVHRIPSPHPGTQSTQQINTFIVDQHSNPEPTNTTGQSPNTFPHFVKLPSKLRSLIWYFAAPAPRTRFLELHTYNTIDHTPRTRYIPPLPPLFSTNQESRNLSIAHEGGEIITFTSSAFTALFSFHGRKIGEAEDGKEGEKSFYFNFSRDILWLSARFTAACNTTETFRLTTLSSILPPATLSRIERLLVSYSGLDSYALIGPVLRPYAHLETLYLCMNDERVIEKVKKLLDKGVPDEGVTAEKLRRILEQAEADETDDDDESEEMGNERLAVRARRRVLEVDLRLEE